MNHTVGVFDMTTGKHCITAVKRMAGFTLIELMIVTAILAIIAAVALPGYRSYVQKAARAEGKAMLVTAASREEQFFQNNKTYTNVLTTAGLNLSALSESGKYQLTIVCNAAPPSCTSFTLTATPQGGQTDDAKCLNLTLTSAGVKGASGTDGTACW